VVVVLSNGAPVEMPWLADVEAVLEGYLGGQAGGGALADILTGAANPSGKLAETFPIHLADTPTQFFPGGPTTVEYRESLYVGYRWYDTAGLDVLFPFGHGLSYTTFNYRDLKVKQSGETVIVSFKVKNTGKQAGKEIAQVYVRDIESTHFRPEKELKGFEKIDLRSGEEKEVNLALGPRAFAYYDAGSQGWVVEPGAFEILIGASSRDIRLQATVTMQEGSGTVSPVDPSQLPSYFVPAKGREFSLAEFETLLGHPVPLNLPTAKGQYTLNTPLIEMQTSWIGRQFYKMVGKNIKKMIEGNEDSPEGLLIAAMVSEMPLRTMLMMGGPLDRKKLEALVLMMNGKFFKGLIGMIK